MRIYIIGNGGITLCREAPATVNEGEIAVASKEDLHAASLSAKRLLALWNALPGVAKEFLKYLIEPNVVNEYLKVGLGGNVPCMPSIVKRDPWWFADPHRKAYTTQALLSPTLFLPFRRIAGRMRSLRTS